MMEGMLLQTLEGLGDGPDRPTSGQLWEWLQGEKEEIAGELLSERPLCQTPVSGVQDAEASIECGRDIDWYYRSQLEARLREVIDAQDRLIEGAYGRCTDCGGEISRQRLAANPAAHLCITCQRVIEGETNFATASSTANLI